MLKLYCVSKGIVSPITAKQKCPNGAPRASPCLHAEVPVFAERLHVDKRFGTQAWSPKTIPTYAKASVGHPPVSEIRRSMID